MSNSKKFSSIVVLVVAFITGLFTFIAVLNKDLIARDPAAVHGKIFDLRSSNPDQLRQEVSNRLKIQTAIETNNFISKAMLFSGLTAQICRSHDKIELEFLADGVSVGGEPTKLIVKTPCQSGQNPLEVGSIRFPIQEILLEKPRSAEFTPLTGKLARRPRTMARDATDRRQARLRRHGPRGLSGLRAPARPRTRRDAGPGREADPQ